MTNVKNLEGKLNQIGAFSTCSIFIYEGRIFLQESITKELIKEFASYSELEAYVEKCLEEQKREQEDSEMIDELADMELIDLVDKELKD